jgi:hypothetical protein
MKHTLAVLFALFLATSLPAVAQTNQIAKTPPVPFDVQKYVDREIQSGKRRVVIPPGRYLVKPAGAVHLRLKGLNDVEIVAKGVEMICTETTQALQIERCRNLTLRGLTIDYDPLPFTQGRITAMAPDKSWLEFELFEGYPENELEQRIEIFDRNTDKLKRDTYYGWQSFESLGNRRYRVAKEKNYKFSPQVDREEIGDILVTNSNHAPGGRVPHAIVTDGSSGVVLEDIRLYASTCFSYLEYNCDGTTYRRCSIDRRPPKEDLVPRGYKRLRSSNADAFHSKHARRGPQLIGCTAKWMGDDCVNICGEYYMVMESRSNTVRIVTTHETNLAVGDPVELVAYAGERLPDAKVMAITTAGVINGGEIRFLAAQHMDEGIKTGLSQPTSRAYAITLDREIELPMGSVIASLNHTGNGFRVEGCDFGFNRSRGILIKGSHGRVSGNRLNGNWGPAILVSPEWWWLESGSSNDVGIDGNTISDCRDTSILVTANGGSGRRAPAGAHNRIAITGNRINQSPFPAIVVSSTRGLTIADNVCGTPRCTFPSRRVGVKRDTDPSPVQLFNCAEVAGNNIRRTGKR